jgi:CRP-like cAMP-binding protein
MTNDVRPKDRETILRFIQQAISESEDLESLVQTFEKGDVLFRQGDSLSNLYLLLNGEIILNHRREDDSNLDLIKLEPGHFVGLVAFTTGNNSLTTAIAGEKSWALCIRQDQFEDYVSDHPKLRHPLQQLMLSNMAHRFLKNVQLESSMNALNKKLETEGEQLKEALEELEESHQKLVHQEKMATLGELVAGFAHEVNNPAAALLRSSEMLKENFNEMNDSGVKAKVFQIGLATQPISSSQVRDRMLYIQKNFPWIKERSQIRKLAQMPDEALELIQVSKKKTPVADLIQQFEAVKEMNEKKRARIVRFFISCCG